MLAATAAVMTFSAMTVSAQNPGGVLVVNEISNGTNGTKEFVELIAGSSDSSITPNNLVDVSGWIIDDNNGIFSGGAASGKGISQGHLRLTGDAVWTSLPAGTLVVLFNGENYDTTLYGTNFNQAVANAQTTGYYANGNAIYVAAGLSKIVEANYYTPIFNNAAYCGSSSYLEDTTWSVVGLRNDCGGDGIQTRCPGCGDFGEPTFYHGVSYGTDMAAVASQGFLAGAYVELLSQEEDSTCATAKNFYLDNATTIANTGNGAFWAYGAANTATPGAANSSANATLISNIAGITGGYVFGRCVPTEIPEEPVDTTSGRGKGVLVVTEISNGPSGNCEYAEMIVANCGADASEFVDVRGWIIDDNSGNFSVNGCVTGTGIGNGHYRLTFDSTWQKVPVGSVIVVYNAGTTTSTTDNCYNLPTSFQYNSSTGVYYLPIAANGTVLPGTAHIEAYSATPAVGSCIYCPTGTANTYVAASNWSGIASFNNTNDAFQVRCPGCNTMFSGAPTFYHGFGYGPATGNNAYAPIAATTNSVGGAVKNTSGSASFFEFTGATAADLANGAQWTKTAAPAASMTPPATIGAVNVTFKNNVLSHNLNLPCCNSTTTLARYNNSGLNNAAAEAQGIVAYPNPANNVLNIEFPATDNTVSVKVIDLNGRTVAEQNATGKSKVQFDVTGLNSGFYIYQVITNGAIQSGKVLINK